MKETLMDRDFLGVVAVDIFRESLRSQNVLKLVICENISPHSLSKLVIYENLCQKIKK